MTMVGVTYRHSFAYRVRGAGSSPTLQVRLASQSNSHEEVDVDAYLDSGANYSLFDGELAGAIGLDLFAGRYRPYFSTTGAGIDARCHDVTVLGPGLPAFTLEIGFSTSTITRNLLGRDFFNLVQIGFRERHLEFYIEPVP